MRIPAFSRANEKDTVSSVLNDVSAVVKPKREFLILSRNSRQDDIQEIVPACAALLQGHAFVLKKLERLAVLSGHAVYRQSAG